MFLNRKEAGQLLSQKLKGFKQSSALVFAIARGGVVIGGIIATILRIPLSVLVVKKIGAPYNPELALGAVAPFHTVYIDKILVRKLGIEGKTLEGLIRAKHKELALNLKKYSVSYPKTFSSKTIILTDDGVATGATIKAAIAFLKSRDVSKIILAVPVIAEDTFKELTSRGEEVIALEIPKTFGSVGQFYEEFSQVEDSEVMKIIQSTNQQVRQLAD